MDERAVAAAVLADTASLTVLGVAGVLRGVRPVAARATCSAETSPLPVWYGFVGPHNLLWTGETITGVVDWVETSTGPAWLDVAHCSSNLALRHGSPTGQRFAAAYTRLSGVQRVAYWEVMDIVGFLPPPGRKVMFDDPGELARLRSTWPGRWPTSA